MWGHGAAAARGLGAALQNCSTMLWVHGCARVQMEELREELEGFKASVSKGEEQCASHVHLMCISCASHVHLSVSKGEEQVIPYRLLCTSVCLCMGRVGSHNASFRACLSACRLCAPGRLCNWCKLCTPHSASQGKQPCWTMSRDHVWCVLHVGTKHVNEDRGMVVLDAHALY